MLPSDFGAWADAFFEGHDREHATQKQVDRYKSRASELRLGQPTTEQEFLDKYWGPYTHEVTPVVVPAGVADPDPETEDKVVGHKVVPREHEFGTGDTFDPLKAFAELGRLDRATIE